MPKISKNQASALTAVSPLDGRYHTATAILTPYVSELAVIQARIEIETKYLIALSDFGVIRRLTSKERKCLNSKSSSITVKEAIRIKQLEDKTNHDVKAVEYYLRGDFSGTSLSDLVEMIHFALTSEDVNNIAYRLMLMRARDHVCVPLLDQLVDDLAAKADKYKNLAMLARTHGQDAIPTTLGKELAVFADRLNGQTRTIASLPLRGKLNGAVGNFNAHHFAAPEINWIRFSQKFIRSFGLEPNLVTTQINAYEDVIALFHAVTRANGVVLNLDQDIWRYISDDWLVQQKKKGEVGSSTMPQKINPILFENSEGNLQIANDMFLGMGRKLGISRLQRDLSDSTTVRNVGTALAYSTLGYQNTLKGLGRIEPDEVQINADLTDNWTILGEAVQTLLRRVGVTDPYSLVAQLTKGQKIQSKEWQQWVDKLPVDDKTKTRLHQLTPENYIGKAGQLVTIAKKQIVKSTKRVKI